MRESPIPNLIISMMIQGPTERRPLTARVYEWYYSSPTTGPLGRSPGRVHHRPSE